MPPTRLFTLLGACVVVAACSTSGPVLPLPSPTVRSTSGEVPVVNIGERRFLLQHGVSSVDEVLIGAGTAFSGDAQDLGELAALNHQGYHLMADVRGARSPDTDEISAHEVSVERSGIEPRHLVLTGVRTNTWLGVPAFQDGKATLLAPSWVTTVREDSEFSSVDAITAAVDAGETICIAGDGFTVALLTTQAATIGAWRDAECDGR